MKKYMVLYMMPREAMAEMMKNATPEQQQANMAEWKRWMEKNASNFIELGSPLGKNMRVGKDGAQMESNDIGGYSIVQAQSEEAVAKMMEDNPTFSGALGGYIEIMEIKPMP